MTLNMVTVTFEVQDAGDDAGAGPVTIAPTSVVTAAGVTVVSQAPVVRQLSAGTVSVELVACDNTGTLPVAGFWAYQITLPGQSPGLYLVNYTNGSTQRFDNLTPVVAQTTYGPAASSGSGSVTDVSVASANGFAGTVANPTATPAITLETTVTGLLKGNGTAVSAAAAGTDYAPATSGSAILKGNGSGGFSAASAGADYLAPAGSGAALTGLTESQIANLVSDLAARAQLAGATFTGYLAPAVAALTDAATIAVNAALGNDFRVTLGGNRTVGAPSNPKDGQKITFEIIQPASGGPYTLTWTSGAGGYTFGSGSAPTLSTAANAIDQAGFRYSSVKGEWLYLGSITGF